MKPYKLTQEIIFDAQDWVVVGVNHDTQCLMIMDKTQFNLKRKLVGGFKK